ncbi:hypothetical protein AcW1_009218 [Taiwanofungus camphoratus]|nr:hypothetical protein AcV5_007240 [Antrodia cinnamomea]KAI0949685.1 hypothetical protein AcW1_009218 [Antrodia cinnamomea]
MTFPMSERLHVVHERDAIETPTPMTSTSTLDSLLSPKEPEAHFPMRQSVAVSDVTDDDARFSTVPLSARQSFDSSRASLSSQASKVTKDDHQNTVALVSSTSVSAISSDREHKKTASTSTIFSVSNVPSMPSHVELQKGQHENEEYSRRSSLEGEQKIQEEFNRRQSGLQEEAQEDNVDWDFWGNVVSDYQKYAAEHPQELAKAIERGIPKTIRGMIWQLMSASKDLELEATYVRLLKETSSHEKAITRDLGRTFPHHAFYTDGRGIGQENLFNVLKAYSLYDPQVGYCQGLPFVVAVLLLYMPDEEAFCLLVRLMYSYDLRGHFLPEMPKLQLRIFQFERLLEEFAPVLHIHFLRQGVKSSMYCSQWFLTMFSYRFPMEVVFRIYDNCLASGIEAMFSFSLALLLKNETTLLSLKFDQLVSFLNTRVFEVYQLENSSPENKTGSNEHHYNVDEFLHDAFTIKINGFMLDTYAEEYNEMIRTRDAHVIEMDALRNSNRNLSAQIKALETNMAQLNTEHCEVLNELVRARLKHEELESELVRYKLL